MKIVKNRARCRKCKDIVESMHRHDIKSCKCGSITVDGGKDYIRRSALDLNDIEELSIVIYDLTKPNTKTIQAIKEIENMKKNPSLYGSRNQKKRR